MWCAGGEQASAHSLRLAVRFVGGMAVGGSGGGSRADPYGPLPANLEEQILGDDAWHARQRRCLQARQQRMSERGT